MLRRILFMACLMLLVSACVSVISQTTMSTVDKSISFPALQKDPESLKGRIVLFGGRIIATIPKADETWIEILEKPLDSRQKPSNNDQSSGRFFVRVKGFLDPAIYESGRMLTVAGAVEGKVVRPLREIDYTYPVITAREHYLWKKTGAYRNPQFRIGIGAGMRF